MTQLKKISIIGILINLSVSFSLFGNDCQQQVSIQTILNSDNIDRIFLVIEEIQNCPHLKDSLALSYHKLSTLYYNINNDLDSAIIYAQKSIVLRNQLENDHSNDVNLGKSYNNIGVFYAEKGRFKIAKENLEKAIKIFEKTDANRLMNSYLELGEVYISAGQYDRASNLLVFIKNKSIQMNDSEMLGRILLTEGFLYFDKKEYSKAIEKLEEAEPVLHKFGTYEDEASCYNSLGSALYRLKQFPKAIDYFQKSNQIYQVTEYCVEIAKSFNNMGLGYKKNNQIQQAFSSFQKGLTTAQSCNSKEIIAQSHDHFGEYYLSKKSYKKALSHFQKAIQTLLPRFQRNEDWHNPTKMDIELAFNKIDLLIYLGDKAKTLRLFSQSENDPKYLTSALELFELGDVVIDQLRKEHQDQDTKLFWRKEAIPFYENAIEVCYEMQDVEKAFFFFEKSKAILLLEALQTSDALELIPDSLKNNIVQLQQNLLKTKEQLESTNFAGAEREDIIRNLVSRQAEFEFEIEQLAKDYPKFYEMKFGTKVLSLAEVQNEFSNFTEKAAIHFFYGEKNIYAITIHLQKIKLHQLGTTSSIEKEIRSLLSFFEKSSNIENAPNDFLQQSKNVYDILIAPLSIGKEEEVIIFPDGALAYLPFEALVTDEAKDIASANYLIKKHKIYYGYSATIFSKQNKKTNHLGERSIAAFAPFADGSVNSKYATLSFSQDELGEISEQIAGSFLKNQEATKLNFLKNSNAFSVLHLSTHAFSSATESKPHIVFADTSLFLSELYGLEIPADLVVLSACQSNIGKLSPGEGVMSLGRGFTFAGAKSLVSSLWNVNAVSTSTILSDFYKNLQNEKPKFESLHAAKLAYLENENIPSYERSPYYWAGLIYYGDDGGVVLKEKTGNNFVWFLLFGMACFVFGFFYIKRKKLVLP